MTFKCVVHRSVKWYVPCGNREIFDCRVVIFFLPINIIINVGDSEYYVRSIRRNDAFSEKSQKVVTRYSFSYEKIIRPLVLSVVPVTSMQKILSLCNVLRDVAKTRFRTYTRRSSVLLITKIVIEWEIENSDRLPRDREMVVLINFIETENRYNMIFRLIFFFFI